MTNKPGKIVISDTTAITYLSQINAIGLLKGLFKTIYIPEAVYHELTRQGDHISGSKEVKNLPWIKVKKMHSYDEYAKKFKKKIRSWRKPSKWPCYAYECRLTNY